MTPFDGNCEWWNREGASFVLHLYFWEHMFRRSSRSKCFFVGNSYFLTQLKLQPLCQVRLPRWLAQFCWFMILLAASQLGQSIGELLHAHLTKLVFDTALLRRTFWCPFRRPSADNRPRLSPAERGYKDTRWYCYLLQKKDVPANSAPLATCKTRVTGLSWFDCLSSRAPVRKDYGGLILYHYITIQVWRARH